MIKVCIFNNSNDVSIFDIFKKLFEYINCQDISDVVHWECVTMNEQQWLYADLHLACWGHTHEAVSHCCQSAGGFRRQRTQHTLQCVCERSSAAHHQTRRSTPSCDDSHTDTSTTLLSVISLGSEDILEIAEAVVSTILAACCDFWQMLRFRNAVVNLCDCPRISDYTHQLIYTLLHINWKWLNDRLSYSSACVAKLKTFVYIRHVLQMAIWHFTLWWLQTLAVKMFTPETWQMDSNTVILTEPLWDNMLMMLLCIYHRLKWCFSDQKLRNLMPWFCRESATIVVTFSIVNRDFLHFYRDFLLTLFIIHRWRHLHSRSSSSCPNYKVFTLPPSQSLCWQLWHRWHQDVSAVSVLGMTASSQYYPILVNSGIVFPKIAPPPKF